MKHVRMMGVAFFLLAMQLVCLPVKADDKADYLNLAQKVRQEVWDNPEERCWELKNVKLTDGEMKFRHTNDWSLSWGGELDNLTTQNGPNIAVTAGTYDIKLKVNWAEGTAKCVMTKK